MPIAKKLVRNAGMMVTIMEFFTRFTYELDMGRTPSNEVILEHICELIDSVGRERAFEMHEVFKCLSNVLLDCGEERSINFLKTA